MRAGRLRTTRLDVLVLTGLLLTPACSNKEAAPQEPVVPVEEKTPYPEDPDIAGPGDPGKVPPPSDTPTSEELPGQLTDDPFGGGKKPPKMRDEPIDLLNDPPPSTDVLPPSTDGGDAYHGAFDDAKHTYKSQTGTAPVVPDGPGKQGGPKARQMSAPAAAVTGAGKAEAVTRYVATTVLNVRRKPNLMAPIVRHLLGGTKVKVELHGEYARIRDGEWVRARYLSAKPTRKVSQAEADRAWKNRKPEQ